MVTVMTKTNVNLFSSVFAEEEEVLPPNLDMLDSFSIELPPLDYSIEERTLRKSPDFSLFDSMVKFEDAEDCGNDIIKKPTSPTKIDVKPTVESEVTCSSEEEKLVMSRKTRKPKTKLGVKISKEKENILTNPIETSETNLVPKRTWNIVVGSKPKMEKSEKLLDFDGSDEIEYEENYTIKLPKKDLIIENNDLIDIGSTGKFVEEKITEQEDLVKIDKSSDEEKGDTTGSSPNETTESDDSSKIPPLANIIDVDDDNLTPSPSLQSSSKSSRKKPKKKRK